MALTERDKNKLIDVVNMRFAEIGSRTDTCSPYTEDNKGPEAWELFIAGHMSTLASGRLKEARRRAIRAGVIFDHEKHPKTPDDSGVVYRGEFVVVTLLVKQGSTIIDPEEMANYLQAKGVEPKLLADAWEHASKPRRPAHEFRASIITDD